jgi:hypothetical protein
MILILILTNQRWSLILCKSVRGRKQTEMVSDCVEIAWVCSLINKNTVLDNCTTASLYLTDAEFATNSKS